MSSTLSSLRSSSPVSEVDVKESLEDQVASQLPSRGRCVVLCITSDKELQWRCLTCAGAHIMKAGPFLHLANPAVNPLSGVRDRPMGVLGTNTYPEVLDGGQLAVGERSLGAEQRHLQRKEIKEQQQRHTFWLEDALYYAVIVLIMKSSIVRQNHYTSNFMKYLAMIYANIFRK